MRIVSIGGGPAGLYFAILMKRADPSHEILVVERNRADDTFGFGVVFSDATLDNFQEADAPSHAAIIRAFAHWDDIDTHYAGHVLRSTGHGFSGMSRQTLLTILQERCAALGVTLRFSSEVDALARYANADLVLAADGANSWARAKHADWFGPRVDWRPNRFVWLGTTFPFPAFTFIFKEDEHGLWRVHAYRYNREHSTFILETTEATWRQAGLDHADEAATAAFAERLFARELDGHRMLTNRSLWRQFPTVRNERWHHGPVVLVGDAAHTAHFSIGSGTKLAMEDVIELARHVRRHRGVPEALAAYVDAVPAARRRARQPARRGACGHARRARPGAARVPRRAARARRPRRPAPGRRFRRESARGHRRWRRSPRAGRRRQAAGDTAGIRRRARRVADGAADRGPDHRRRRRRCDHRARARPCRTRLRSRQPRHRARSDGRARRDLPQRSHSPRGGHPDAGRCRGGHAARHQLGPRRRARRPVRDPAEPGALAGIRDAAAPLVMKSTLIDATSPKTWALIFDKGDEPVAGLTAVAKAQNVGAAHFTAIGAFSDVTLGYFDRAAKDYTKIPLREQVEVLSLIGDVALYKGEPRVHAHVVVGRADGEARGGHLLESHVLPTLEGVLVESPRHLRKRYDPETGLALIDPTA